jgi:serine/threonine-protein kinase
MMYVDGPTLQVRIEQDAPLSAAPVADLLEPVAAALDYAHRSGVIHRDIKPDNILRGPLGGYMLLDFGIAKALAESGTTRLTRSGFTVGTSTYMSPEQVAGAQDIDHRTDLYSLACVLFEALAGRPPFVHPREEVVLRLQQTEEPQPVRELRPDTPPALADAIARALKKDRTERWGAAEEMLAGVVG